MRLDLVVTTIPRPTEQILLTAINTAKLLQACYVAKNTISLAKIKSEYVVEAILVVTQTALRLFANTEEHFFTREWQNYV